MLFLTIPPATASGLNTETYLLGAVSVLSSVVAWAVTGWMRSITQSNKELKREVRYLRSLQRQHENESLLMHSLQRGEPLDKTRRYAREAWRKYEDESNTTQSSE